MGKKKSAAKAAPDALNDPFSLAATHEPTPEVTKAKGRKRRKFVTIYVWVALVFFAPAIVALFITASNASNNAGTSSEPSNLPAGHDTAVAAVNRWLKTNPSPLPGGQVIGWDSHSGAYLPTDKDGGTGSLYQRVETHNLSLTDATGAVYKASVQLAFTSDGVQSIIGTPSLMPVEPAEDDSDAPHWATLATTTASDAVEKSVMTWLQAYSSADPTLLAQTIGDPNANHNYMPLVGLKLDPETTVFNDAGHIDDKTVVVNITVNGKWAGQSVGEGQEAPAYSYDLLVKNANTASPRVVAWGASGTGEDMKPYQNAIVGRQVVVDDETTEGDLQ